MACTVHLILRSIFDPEKTRRNAHSNWAIINHHLFIDFDLLEIELLVLPVLRWDKYFYSILASIVGISKQSTVI